MWPARLRFAEPWALVWLLARSMSVLVLDADATITAH